MKTINNYLIICIALILLNSCTSLNDEVKEYRSISDTIEQIYDEISAGTKSQEIGIAEILKLKNDLQAFEEEVVKQYESEEKIKREIEIKNRDYQKQFTADSIKQSKLDKKNAELKARSDREQASKLKAEEARAKKEVGEMIKAEEKADYNLYLYEEGLFVASFDGKDFEVNQKEWNEWKNSQDYDHAEAMAKYREMFSAMGHAKANQLANSLYRTVSKKIASEGISYKAVEGIQVYNVLTTGETKFD